MPKSVTDKKMTVLNELERHGNKARAARKVDVTRQTINRWMKDSSVFGAACEAAVAKGKSE